MIDLDVRPTKGTTMNARPILRFPIEVAMSAAALVVTTGTASAGPPAQVFEANDQTWQCHEDGFPAPSHCTNLRSKGRTGLILVFPPDDRGPAEGVSGPNADDRPCPHDPGLPDGTWWEVVPDTFVCHHKP